jgi:hypothetical protein
MAYYVCSRNGSVEFTQHESQRSAQELAAIVSKRNNTHPGDTVVVQAGDYTEAGDLAAEYFRKHKS